MITARYLETRFSRHDFLSACSMAPEGLGRHYHLLFSWCIITNARIRRSEESLPDKRWPLRPDSTFVSDGKGMGLLYKTKFLMP
jgi:hypothetical protein